MLGDVDVIIFILIACLSKTEKDTFNAIYKVHGNIEVHPLFGEWDIIAKFEIDTFEEIYTIVDIIHGITVDGVKSVTNTKTLTGIKF